jgi:hypothetical protein
MKTCLLFFLLGISNFLFGQDTFRLAPPQLKFGSVFFSGKTVVAINFAQQGTTVHYNLKNEDPAITDKVYTKPILIKKNFTTLKAKAFGNDFFASETVAATFIKSGKNIAAITQTAPHAKYPGNGVKALSDNQGGDLQLSSKTWMGYNCDTVSISLDLGKPQNINQVLLHFLQSENAWVFLPSEILVNWFDQATNSFHPFGIEKIETLTETPGSHCVYRIIESKNKIKTNKILINIIVVKNIPTWHPAKGAHAWMFIDEIKVY